jgi:isochorismate synthase
MVTTVEKADQRKEKEIIGLAIRQSLHLGQSFSLWKMPASDSKHLIICQEPEVVIEYSLEDGAPGFAFAPFSPEEKKYFFPADIYYRFENGIQVAGPSTESLKNNFDPDQQSATRSFFIQAVRNEPATPSDFIRLVNLGLEEIAAGRMEKLVPSTFKEYSLPASFDLLKAFDTLCTKHPQALVSLVSSPQTGTWLGATPELLVSVNRENKFKTLALAGTLPYHDEVNLKTVAWTQKEIEEQALVCRYIINCFKKIRLREYEEHGPRTVVAGNVMHLKTEYEVDMTATNFPQLGSIMLKLLHPTSAVCGMPFEPAYAFLKQYENYDREFYSGYLGPVQIHQESHIYVNLRCMQLFQKHARMYAGAGITIDSIPEKELEETDIKMQNLQNVLNG